MSVRLCCHSQEKVSFVSIIEVFYSGQTPAMLMNRKKSSPEMAELRSVPDTVKCLTMVWTGLLGSAGALSIKDQVQYLKLNWTSAYAMLP